MTNEEALQKVISAANSLARLKADGNTICFDNYIDMDEGEEIKQALAHLTRRAVDVANAHEDGLALHNVLVAKFGGVA